MKLYNFLPYRNKVKTAGFTIIELMVTVTIVVLVTGLIMVQYSSFNNSVLLKDQAYLTAFDIREAQALAVSVRGQGAQFREEYGLYFDMAQINKYLLFQDNDALYGATVPAQYNPGEEVGVPYKVDPRFAIVNICVTNASARTCYKDDPATAGETIDATLKTLAITFRRPNFDAAFYSPSKAGIESAEIHFSTPSAKIMRVVTVYQTGQVSVK